MNKRVVISGIGVVSPIGIGRDAFWQNLIAGTQGLKVIGLFDVSGFSCKKGGEITDLETHRFFDSKKLLHTDRSIQLVCCAAKLALEDAGLQVQDTNRSTIGVVIGSNLGSVRSVGEFDRTLISEGFWALNAISFPNTVHNSPSSQVSLKLGVDCFNTTISTGYPASLDSIIYGVDSVRSGRAKMVLAGGVEELCQELFVSYYVSGLLSGSPDGKEFCAPFDKRRNGIILGEGSAVIILEEYEEAKKRGGPIYAEVLGHGMSFEPPVQNGSLAGYEGVKRAIGQALSSAQLRPDDIDYVSANANSSRDYDRMEAIALRRVGLEKTSVSSIKSMVGECCSASGSFQVCAAALALEKQLVPPTVNYREFDPHCDLNIIAQTTEQRVNRALVNSIGCNGNNTSLILGRSH